MTTQRLRHLCLAGLVLWVLFGAAMHQVAYGSGDTACIHNETGERFENYALVFHGDTAPGSTDLTFSPCNPHGEADDGSDDVGEVSTDPPRGGLQINGPGRVAAPAERNPEPVIYDTAPPPVPGYSLSLFGSEGPGR